MTLDFMMNVTIKPIMLSVIVLNVVVLSVEARQKRYRYNDRLSETTFLKNKKFNEPINFSKTCKNK